MTIATEIFNQFHNNGDSYEDDDGNNIFEVLDGRCREKEYNQEYEIMKFTFKDGSVIHFHYKTKYTKQNWRVPPLRCKEIYTHPFWKVTLIEK